MIRMAVSVQHRVDLLNPSPQGLKAKFGGSVDQNVQTAGFHQNR
jgi:hypothetical protein